MTKFTRLEAFQELSVILARIEQKIDNLLEIESRVKMLEAELDTRLNQKYYPSAGEMEEAVYGKGKPKNYLNPPKDDALGGW